LLKMTRNEQDPIDEISKIHKELNHFNIELLPPHILKSEMDFSIVGDDIRFGLLSIKGISDKSIEKLQNFRKKYSNKFEVFQGAQESKIGIGILSALIQAGALESDGQTRSRTVLEAQLWNILTDRERRIISKYTSKFNENLHDTLKYVSGLTQKDAKGNDKPIIKDTRKNTIRKNYKPCKEIYDINRKSEDLANWYYEKSLLGFSYRKSLREIYSEKRGDLSSIVEIQDMDMNENLTVVASINEHRTGKSKKGTKYYRATISDETGITTILVFNDSIDTMKSKNNNKLPKESNVVIVQGIKKDDAIFAHEVSVQDQKIYTSLSKLKSDRRSTD